jgi:hypothetical protein
LPTLFLSKWAPKGKVSSIEGSHRNRILYSVAQWFSQSPDLLAGMTTMGSVVWSAFLYSPAILVAYGRRSIAPQKRSTVLQ